MTAVSFDKVSKTKVLKLRAIKRALTTEQLCSLIS